MAAKKMRARDIKKQRWASIVAAILALGMVVSLVGVYIGQAVGGSAMPGQQEEPQPEDYLAYYQGEVNRLETYIEEHGESANVLLELAENYRYLGYVQQMFFEDEEAHEQSQERLSDLQQSLVELEPENARYRLELLGLYIEQQKDESLIDAEAELIQELLRKQPDPQVHLSFIQTLSMIGAFEEVQNETVWLNAYLKDRVEQGLADSEEQFYYAVFLADYVGDDEEAVQILEMILEQESEESSLYQNAFAYLQYLRSDENDIVID